jgi:CBS-domain-containing membrane protein
MTNTYDDQIRCTVAFSQARSAFGCSSQHDASSPAGLCSLTVITIPAQKSALEALRMMQEHDISGVAIVDEQGRLLGNFSVSDLRSIMVEHLGALALPVIDFLQVSRDMEDVDGALILLHIVCM